MKLSSFLHRPEWTMKRKLFGYMLILTALILIVLMAGLLLFGRLGSTEKHTYESLDVQMEVFEKDITTHFEHLAAAGINLSDDMTILLEEYLTEYNMSFLELKDSGESITAVEERIIEPLKATLMQTDCSGAFVMLDTTVNSALENADKSRAGLYLQLNGYETSRGDVVLYRGISSIGKSHSIMPHRKWLLEFRTDFFPNYEEIVSLSSLPLEKAYSVTNLIDLPGTSEKAVFMAVPIVGTDGTFYGICGYEVSASYYMTYHAQPTKIEHLTCLLTPSGENSLIASVGLSCGVADSAYHQAPSTDLNIKKASGGLSVFKGEALSYIGLTRNVKLSPNNEEHTLSVMFPKKDYDRIVNKSVLQNVVLWLLIVFFAVSVCMYFSKRFLSPILRDLEQLKTSKRKLLKSDTPELNNLFAFLAEQDREHEAELHRLMLESEAAKSEADRLQAEYEEAKQKYETAQTEISRLAYARKSEVDPDDYQNFLAGIKTLTAKEREIFDYYLEGKTVKEIIVLSDIKDSTVRYHNQNIYSKLGVNSLKQLLRYAALMQQEGEKVGSV